MTTAMLWPPTFAGAIFDFDGTIADTAAIWREVDEAFLGARGIAYTHEYARILSVLGFEAGARYTIDTYQLQESVEDICDEWNRMGRAFYRTRVQLRPGAKEYICALRNRGIPVALATSNDPQVLDSMLTVNVDELFDLRVHGCEVGVPKDEPDIYLEAARRIGVAPEKCIVFEDIEPGLKAAASAGFLTCGLRSGDPSQRETLVQSASHIWLKEWTDIELS